MPVRSSNIPSYIFYETIMSEIIRIARFTLLLDDFDTRIGALLIRRINQGADRWKILHQCQKSIINHSQIFDKFATTFEIIKEKILQTLG